MRKVVASMLFITLDGVTEEPSNWQETFDEDMAANLQAHVDEVDTIILGRVTYQYWEPYWPTATHEPFATFINTTPKYVVSKTLDKVSWGKFDNIKLLKGNLTEEITKLKQQAGKTIAVEASPTLVNSLLQQGLLDELRLIIHNVVAYQGKRLFKEGNLTRLNLIVQQSHSNRCHHCYLSTSSVVIKG
jgi:dihydrofolate reductase